MGSRLSRPPILTEVYKSEAASDSIHGDFKLMILACHAALLDSGFASIKGFNVLSSTEIQYTIPHLLKTSICLKFECFGEELKVNGHLKYRERQSYSLSLNKTLFLPSLAYFSSKINAKDSEYYGHDSLNHPKQVLKFLAIVKDRIALPLYIDLGEVLGLPKPTSFTSLPPELKLLIIGLLRRVDIIRVGSVSWELKHLISSGISNDLWEQKCDDHLVCCVNIVQVGDRQ